MKMCIFKGCDKSSKNGARGLCPNHYVGWLNRVKRGTANWKELEEQGLVLRLMTQEEKNMNQMHKHNSYNRKTNEQKTI